MTTLYQLEQRPGEEITLYQVEHTGQWNPLPESQPQRGELDEDLITHRLGIPKELMKGGMVMMMVVVVMLMTVVVHGDDGDGGVMMVSRGDV